MDLTTFVSVLGVRNEGWFDPWLLLSAFRKKLTSMGVRFLHAEVTGVHVEHSTVRRVKVHKQQYLKLWPLKPPQFSTAKFCT